MTNLNSLRSSWHGAKNRPNSSDKEHDNQKHDGPGGSDNGWAVVTTRR